MTALDLGTRKLWRAVGRPVDLTGGEGWLRAPTSAGSTVADGWLEAEAARLGGEVVVGESGAGLMPDLSVLDGEGFRAADLSPRIRAFYEHTSDWRMEVWAGWSPLFWPGGELVSRLFGRRVQQLALPMRPLAVAHGMDSRVALIRDAAGGQVAAGWLRTLRTTGEFVFSGCYSARRLPGADRSSVHVAFPLESGNVQVFLRPEYGPARSAAGRSLVLRSSRGAFGDDGAYVVVEDGGGHHAARVPIHETFHVYVDEEGVLRTDHDLRMWGASAVRLHYRLEERA